MTTNSSWKIALTVICKCLTLTKALFFLPTFDCLRVWVWKSSRAGEASTVLPSSKLLRLRWLLWHRVKDGRWESLSCCTSARRQQHWRFWADQTEHCCSGGGLRLQQLGSVVVVVGRSLLSFAGGGGGGSREGPTCQDMSRTGEAPRPQGPCWYLLAHPNRLRPPPPPVTPPLRLGTSRVPPLHPPSSAPACISSPLTLCFIFTAPAQHSVSRTLCVLSCFFSNVHFIRFNRLEV